MPNKGEAFEIACTDYLNDTFGDYAVFTQEGGYENDVSDIHVKTKNGKDFYIEVKMKAAPGASFSVIPDHDKKEFIFAGSHDGDAKLAELIIEELNKDFDKYSTDDQSGEKIPISQELCANWMIDHYVDGLNAPFVISGTENNFVLIKMQDVGSYFKFNPMIRKLRKLKPLKQADIPKILEAYKDLNAKATINKKGEHVVTADYIKGTDEREIDGKPYAISAKSKTVKEVNTDKPNNPRVMIGIQLTNNKGISEEEFIEYLEN